MSAQSVRAFIRNSSALLSIAYDYNRPCPVTVTQKRLISRSARVGQHPAGRALQQAPQPARPTKSGKASLVIFDKDGTLICFHSMWVPWAFNTAERVDEATKLNLRNEIYAVLGFSPTEKRVKSGLLASGTMAQIRDAIARALISHGIKADEALKIVTDAIKDSDKLTSQTVKQIHDLRKLFEELRANNVKIAVCTSDNRQGTMNALRSLQLDGLVDVVVCGDDAGAIPKPHPHNALSICRELDVDPQEAIVVGDTLADIGMGRSANLGGTVGVLSGICGSEELRPYSDHVVSDVGNLMPIVLDMRRMSLF